MGIIFFGADHAGYHLKEYLRKNMLNKGFNIKDCGTHNTESVDYPLYAMKVAENILKGGDSALGILICGTGIGMSIAANRFKGIRAALCHSEYEAKLARNHNNANILCLGAKIITNDMALKCLETFLKENFEKGRHKRRLNLINSISASIKDST
ncbi:MAG: ribose 5-phosphate isomerase B [Alphaproteobacteria bacterium]